MIHYNLILVVPDIVELDARVSAKESKTVAKPTISSMIRTVSSQTSLLLRYTNAVLQPLAVIYPGL
jgi:hypothetical protein